MTRNGLVVSGLSLTNSAAAVPQANVQCSSGSYDMTCISEASYAPLSLIDCDYYLELTVFDREYRYIVTSWQS